MKLKQNDITVEESGTISEGDFGISIDDQAHILSLLRDKLYSDKFKAVLREYGANAKDAHVEAGIPNRPIEVTLPTTFSSELKIRDFGFGLSQDGVYNTFARYGKSTKRNSDEVVGQLGLGCKSAFAYSTCFGIRSIQDGISSQYTAFIDESNKGKIVLLEQKKTNEEQGLEITVPINPVDAATFIDRAKSVYQYFNPRPKFLGKSIDFPVVDKTKGVHTDTWSIVEGSSGYASITAIMGNIGYPVNGSSLTDCPAKLKPLLTEPITINFDIGELSVAASRESLEYTANTRQAIYRRLKVIHDTLTEKLKGDFDAMETPWDARKLYRSLTTLNNSTHYNNERKGLVSELVKSSFRHLTIDGHKYDLAEFQIKYDKALLRTLSYGNDNIDGLTLREIATNKKGFSNLSYSHHLSSFSINEFLNIIVVDDTFGYLRKFAHWRGSQPKDPTDYYNRNGMCPALFLFGDKDTLEKSVEDFLIATGLKGIKLYRTSEMEAPPSTSAYSSIAGVDKKRTAKKVFRLADTTLSKHPKSDNWNDVDIELEEEAGIYIRIKSFLPDITSPETFPAVQRALEILGHDFVNEPIYGFKNDIVIPEDAEWTEWSVWQKKRVEELVTGNTALLNYFQSIKLRKSLKLMLTDNVSRLNMTDTYLQVYIDALGILTKEVARLDQEVGKGDTQFARISKSILNTIVDSFFSEIEIRHPIEVEIALEIYNKYPLIRLLPASSFLVDSNLASVVNYMRLIDQTNEKEIVNNKENNEPSIYINE